MFMVFGWVWACATVKTPRKCYSAPRFRVFQAGIAPAMAAIVAANGLVTGATTGVMTAGAETTDATIGATTGAEMTLNLPVNPLKLAQNQSKSIKICQYQLFMWLSRVESCRRAMALRTGAGATTGATTGGMTGGGRTVVVRTAAGGEIAASGASAGRRRARRRRRTTSSPNPRAFRQPNGLALGPCKGF